MLTFTSLLVYVVKPRDVANHVEVKADYSHRLISMVPINGWFGRTKKVILTYERPPVPDSTRNYLGVTRPDDV